VPLILFTSKRRLMGQFVNRRVTTLVASGVAGIIIVLNIFLLAQTFGVG
jgi:manganese transport protein